MFDKTIQNKDIAMKVSMSGDVTLSRGDQTEHLDGKTFLDLTYASLDAYLKSHQSDAAKAEE